MIAYILFFFCMEATTGIGERKSFGRFVCSRFFLSFFLFFFSFLSFLFLLPHPGLFFCGVHALACVTSAGNCE